GGLGDQAEHEMAFAGKIVEVAGMNDDTHLPQEVDGQIFVSSKDGNAQHNVPSSFDLQSCARGTARKLAIEFREIRSQAIEKNGLDLLALIEQHRRGKLHGSVQREKRIGDDFQARSRFGDYLFWP